MIKTRLDLVIKIKAKIDVTTDYYRATKTSFLQINLFLGNSKLLLEGLGHSWGRWTWKSKLNFNAIVDKPLKSSKRTNHNDSGTETCPHTFKAQGSRSITNATTLSFVHVAYNSISRMRYYGTEYTSNVSSSKSYNQLLRLTALGPWFWYNILINSFNSTFKARELHHSVGNLSSPQRNQGFVKSTDAFLCHNFRCSTPQCSRESPRQRSLHSHLTSLHGRQGNIGEELSRGRCNQIQTSPVEEGILFTHHTTINILKYFVESKFAYSLGCVTNGSRSPAEEKSLGASIGNSNLKSISKTLVLFLIDLKPALDQIQRGYSSVSKSTRESTTHSTQGVVFGRTKFAGIVITSGCN